MKLAVWIFGTETRLSALIKAVLVATSVRLVWAVLTAYAPNPWVLIWALFPGPWHRLTWTVWLGDAIVIFYQARAMIRLGLGLLLRAVPKLADRLGLSDGRRRLAPRERSWLPTALLLSWILSITCCMMVWIGATLAGDRTGPFDFFMYFNHLGMKALLAGLVLSLLGLLFGGRYIAGAAEDIGDTFRVANVDDSHWLADRVHGIADRLNLPRPAVGVTDVMNAFAMGATQKSSMVVIGKPLFALEDDELDAIIGHELGHVLHKDVARMQFAEGFQRVLVTLVAVLSGIAAVWAFFATKKDANRLRNVRLALSHGKLARHTVFCASELVTKGISRNREFHADIVGAHVTSPEAMARALRRVHDIPDKPTAAERNYGYLMFRGSGFGRLFATHPPVKARLRALDAYAAARRKAAETKAATAAPENA